MASSASVSARVGSPSYQAYQILHIAFVAPLVAGVDKFFHFLVNWTAFVAARAAAARHRAAYVHARGGGD